MAAGNEPSAEQMLNLGPHRALCCCLLPLVLYGSSQLALWVSLNPQGGFLDHCFDMQLLLFAVRLAPPSLQPAACKNPGITKHCGKQL